ncbi:NADPH-dependent 1-acyldihydroxyacetone phosphate reductase [Vanrija pseudolonga]|uniref:NADPH-dependent 1-acyldihydroxyacetone phosphate reductase n=1 Tax=Vanrija pseudolonga TaxID=143232 RepID=A0AAF1BSY9_9TREE|nr:NADPH-dependent 1-acyldihydroxyacetone phosphate reductase [Vanrija pseudolonga]
MPRVALITGCSEPTSIGAAIALELHRRGVRVFATARRIETLKPLAEAGCDTLELDVTKAESIAAAVGAVTSAAGRLDILINNAGVSGTAPLLETDLDRMRALYEVNVFGPLALAQAFTPLLHSEQHDSVILNVGSGACWGPPMLGAYGSSKAAIQAWSDALRRELAGSRIHVVTLELLAVNTPLCKLDKTFALHSSTPSGLFPNFAEWDRMFADEAKVQAERGARPADVARRIANVVLAKKPPGKIWAGNPAWLFRYFWPLAPVKLMDYAFWLVGKVKGFDPTTAARVPAETSGAAPV